MVTVLIAVVGLGLTVGTPIIKLNQNITSLNVTLDHLRGELTEQKKALKDHQEKAHRSHEKLWGHNTKQDEMLQDHERRITVLEHVEE